ncbi:MAG: hypothetical protein WD058_02275, partial [Dehalococcoidia bacterium]
MNEQERTQEPAGAGTLFDYLAAARREVQERHLSVVPPASDVDPSAPADEATSIEDVAIEATHIEETAIEATAEPVAAVGADVKPALDLAAEAAPPGLVSEYEAPEVAPAAAVAPAATEDIEAAPVPVAAQAALTESAPAAAPAPAATNQPSTPSVVTRDERAAPRAGRGNSAVKTARTEGGRMTDYEGLPPIKVVGVGGGGTNAVNRMLGA